MKFFIFIYRYASEKFESFQSLSLNSLRSDPLNNAQEFHHSRHAEDSCALSRIAAK
jgi:hypothetical protein